MIKRKWEIIYFESPSHRCPVKKYINELNIHTKAKVIRTIELLEEFGIDLPHPFVKHVRGKIWELRVSNERILYFIFDETQIILLHGFTKKTQRLPLQELEIAENRILEIERKSQL